MEKSRCLKTDADRNPDGCLRDQMDGNSCGSVDYAATDSSFYRMRRFQALFRIRIKGDWKGVSDDTEGNE